MKVLGDNSTINKLLLITVIISIAFALFIIPIAVKSVNGEYCSSEQSKQITKNYINSTIILNSENSYFLTQKNYYEQEDYIKNTEYCFKANNNGSEPLNINIINSELETINNNYFPLGVNTLCTKINTDNNILGVQCLNCNSDSALIMFDDPTSNDETINLNGELSLNNPLSTNIITYLKCNQLIKNVFKYYIYFLSLMSFILLIIWGVDGFGGFLLEW